MVGDMVLAENPDDDEGAQAVRVSQVLENYTLHLVQISLQGQENAKPLEATGKHLLLTKERGWVEAGKLQTGEHLRDDQGGWRRIAKVVKVSRQDSSHNLVVDKLGTFFVMQGSQPVLVDAGSPRRQLDEPLEAVFVTGTQVHTEQGLVPVEKLKVGSKVLARNTGGQLAYQTILSVAKTAEMPLFRLHMASVDGEPFAVEAAPEQRFWVKNRGWIELRLLEAGMTLRSRGGEARLKSVEALAISAGGVSLEVQGWHNFFVDGEGLWVHNQAWTDHNPSTSWGDGWVKDAAPNIKNLAKDAPMRIPESAARYRHKPGAAYDQYVFRWYRKYTEPGGLERTRMYEARWHEPTPGAPRGSVNNWRVTRVTKGANPPGSPTVAGYKHELVVSRSPGETREWVTTNEFNAAVNADKARREGSGTATRRQTRIAENSHVPARACP